MLALVAGALLTLRLLPLAARLGDRVAARGRGLVMPVAAWQISRRTLRQAGPTLVGVLAVAAAVMALAQRDSWHGSVQAQASFEVGADTRITIPPAAQLSARPGHRHHQGTRRHREHAGRPGDDQPAQRQPRHAARARHLLGAEP